MTQRQQHIYDYILSYTELHGYSPTHREISNHEHLSLSTVHYHLKAMEMEGILTFNPGSPRTIKILKKPENLSTAQSYDNYVELLHILRKLDTFFADPEINSAVKEAFYAKIKKSYRQGSKSATV